MAIDTQVPAWLQPPSETERRQLELQEQAVAAKASSMLRKNIGFARMKAQAAQMTANGWDENTARKKALLDNAELIFSDNPEAVANIMQSEEVNAAKARSDLLQQQWKEREAFDRDRTRMDTESWRKQQVERWDADRKSREALAGGETLRFTSPTGEIMEVIRGQGGAAAKVPIAQQNKAEEAVDAAVSISRLTGTLSRTLRPEDVGLWGAGGEVIVDRGLAQLVPELANLKRIDSRTLLKMARNQILQGLKIDSQMSNEERKQLEGMAPSDSALESVPRALQMLRTLNKEIATRSRFRAERAGRPVPKELLKPSELLELVRLKKMSPEEGSQLAHSSPFSDELDEILKAENTPK